MRECVCEVQGLLTTRLAFPLNIVKQSKHKIKRKDYFTTPVHHVSIGTSHN